MSTASHPFDAAAESYDAEFTHRRLGRQLRLRVREELEGCFAPGDRVLELCCGTGEDAVWLASQGARVLATDGSAEMVATVRRKTEQAGVADRVFCQGLDLTKLNADTPSPAEEPFDGVLSNFGGLNCIPEWQSLAQALGGWVRPGGKVALVVMGPLCPWEVATYLLLGKPRTAFRRFHREGVMAHVGEGQSLRVWYPSPSTLERAFAEHFVKVRTVGIGVLLPPSYLAGLVERWPRTFDALESLERRLARRFPATWLNDHYLMLFERR